jgi:hypothetical protein
MSEIEIYSQGPVACSVCAPKEMERGEVERLVNLENPTGIESRWHISDDTHFASGHSHPGPCPDNTLTRTHYLLTC